MHSTMNRAATALAAGLISIFFLVTPALCSGKGASGDAGPQAKTAPQVIQPAELVKLLQAPKRQQPLVLQVGFRVLYEQAHIPGSEYIGAASEEQGRQELRKRVQNLSRNRYIVLYCGCCPWSHCPNVHPAYKELRAMGFRNVKILYIANNFGADWVDKGYPVAKGK